jgi:triosephosphate isomerase (TIM)
MRTPIIAGNWKMNTSVNEAIELVKRMLQMDRVKGVKKIICPPFVSLIPVKNLIENSSIELGAQNMYFEEKGAMTGEISPVMLNELCRYVILGHSERRQYFAETDEMINKKVKTAIRFNLVPILCVGETLKEKETEKTHDVVSRQVSRGLKGINATDPLVIAYEPVWAIGTGKSASVAEATSTISLIRATVEEIWSREEAQAISILYGGSTNKQNITEFVRQDEIDGALVGGASLKADEFVDMVKQTAEIKNKA